MYSGTTIRKQSGNILGAHQRIDRIAHRILKPAIPMSVVFPAIKPILYFEGHNGPDGIKSKSPSRDEPWHYIDPTDPGDTMLLEYIEDHVANLVTALVSDNQERAAFEAAWLSHAIVDGLTPAHHYPLEEKIEELWGHSKDERLTFKQKNIIKGTSKRDTVSKNWQYWGARGVFTTHFMFEFGFATTIASLKLDKLAKPSGNERVRVEKEGIVPIFIEAMHQVHALRMYEAFSRSGWTRKLARQTRQDLAPIIIRTVCLAWYAASIEAAKKKAKSA